MKRSLSLNLVSNHVEYLYNTIRNLVESLENKRILFDGDGYLIEDTTYVKEICKEDGTIMIVTHDKNRDTEFKDNLDFEDNDDLFFTHLLYGIEECGFNSYKWESTTGMTRGYVSNETFNSIEDAYAAMRMQAFIEIENLTNEKKEFNVVFKDNCIVINEKTRTTTYEILYNLR